MKYKPLPNVKVYEAFTAVVSDRIEIIENSETQLITKIYSSTRDKFYSVKFDKLNKAISSDDNSAYFQHTLSYPMLASFMKTGIISYDLSIANLFKDIEWKKINTKFRNNYEAAVEFVIAELKLDQNAIANIRNEVQRISEEFNKLILN